MPRVRGAGCGVWTIRLSRGRRDGSPCSLGAVRSRSCRPPWGPRSRSRRTRPTSRRAHRRGHGSRYTGPSARFCHVRVVLTTSMLPIAGRLHYRSHDHWASISRTRLARLRALILPAEVPACFSKKTVSNIQRSIRQPPSEGKPTQVPAVRPAGATSRADSAGRRSGLLVITKGCWTSRADSAGERPSQLFMTKDRPKSKPALTAGF